MNNNNFCLRQIEIIYICLDFIGFELDECVCVCVFSSRTEITVDGVYSDLAQKYKETRRTGRD